MKYLLFTFILLYIQNLNAKAFQLILNFTGSYKKNEIVFLDQSMISHNIYEAEWTDNYGNYGTARCLTSIKYDKEKIITDLDSYCKFNDQHANIFTQHNTRKGNELSAGVGDATFIEGQNKWKYLIGASCMYSIRYLQDRIFSIRKCKITENMHEKFTSIK